MVSRDVAVGLVFDDQSFDEAALSYAVALARGKQGRLTALLCAPMFVLPSARLVPDALTTMTQVNKERRAQAEAVARAIDEDVLVKPFAVDTRILQERHGSLVAAFAAAARLCDLCVLSRPSASFTAAMDLVEAAIFNTGRPAILVPPNWDKPAALNRIVVAWDGGARAARAIGDAMSLLQSARHVDIVCVSEDAEKSLNGADLSAHLGRRCKSVELVELDSDGDDVGSAIRDYARKVRADMIVMGAFVHPRIVQALLGGTTRDMILSADIPVFLSY